MVFTAYEDMDCYAYLCKLMKKILVVEVQENLSCELHHVFGPQFYLLGFLTLAETGEKKGQYKRVPVLFIEQVENCILGCKGACLNDLFQCFCECMSSRYVGS